MKNSNDHQNKKFRTWKSGKSWIYAVGAVTTLVAGAATTVSAQADDVDTVNNFAVDSEIASSDAVAISTGPATGGGIAPIALGSSIVASSDVPVATTRPATVVATTAEDLYVDVSAVSSVDSPAEVVVVPVNAEAAIYTITSTSGDRVIEIAGVVNNVINTIAKATIIGAPVGWVSTLVYNTIATITRAVTTTTR